MKYLHYEVDAQDGDVIEVTLDHAANVQLLDPGNFAKYREGRPFRYQDGGYTRVSPVRLPVPHAGQWHVVIDLGGGPGHVRAAMQVLSGSNL